MSSQQFLNLSQPSPSLQIPPLDRPEAMVEMDDIPLASWRFVLASILVGSIALFLLKSYQERSTAIRLKKQGFVSRLDL